MLFRSTPTFGVNLLYQVYQSRFWQQGRRAAVGAPCQPQTAGSAKDPLQDTAQPSSQVGGTFVKTPDKQRNEGEKSEEQQYEHKSQKRRCRRRCSRHQSRDSPAIRGEDHIWSRYPHRSLGRSPHQSSWVFPEGIAAHEEPTQEQGKSVRRKEQKKNCYKLTVTPHPPLRGRGGRKQKSQE